MSHKVKKDDPKYCPNQPRRWRFVGNQFTGTGNEKVGEISNDEAGISAKKLKALAEDVINLTVCYRIIEFVSVFSALADIHMCRECKQKVSFGQSGERGLGFKISVHCRCEKTLRIPSGLFVHNAFEINRHIVFAMRLLGVAREGINILL